MDADKLFLRRCKQVASLLESNDEVDLVDLSKHLRQLLCDRHTLVDTVNSGRERISLEFRVGEFSTQPDKYTAILTLEDGIDPHTRRPNAPSLVLSHKKFLKHVVIHAFDQSLSVFDIIRHATAVAGGVHHDPYAKGLLAQLSKRNSVGGLPLGIRMLKAIARVTMRALDPLIKKVESRN